MTDDQFLRDFLQGRLPRRQFDHLGHLRAAWLLLQRQPLTEAIENCCRGIQSLATAFGATGKFHRTRTEALMRLMAAAARSASDFEGLLAARPELVHDARGLLARHYSAERLDSEEARIRFVAPDLQNLPE